jgi:RES domain-containing protein
VSEKFEVPEEFEGSLSLELGGVLPKLIQRQQRCWRILAPKWAYDPLSGEGAARFGGRFNPKGTPALYLSEEIDTAFAEYQQDLLVRPGTFCAYQLDVAGIIDLCNPSTQAAIRINEQILLSPWKEILLVQKRQPPTWDLVVQLLKFGVTGVRVPSAQKQGGVNLVLWRWNDDPSRRIGVLDPRCELPSNQASWP